jgi:hypothetical protein
MPLSTLGRLVVGGRLWAIGSMIGAGLGGIKCGKEVFDEDGEELMFKLEKTGDQMRRGRFEDGELMFNWMIRRR